MIKEACVESFLEAKIAEERGANRIELCDNLEKGGTTPSYGTIKLSIEKLNIPVFPIIRPRGGDFFYSNEEINIMKEDIKICKSLGAKGVVLGVLKKDKTIDYKTLKEFIEIANPMEVTFHKAIDEICNPIDEIENLISVGVKRILSSGTKSTAILGEKTLNSMIEKAQNRIIIVVAGKITKDNLEDISKRIKSIEYHGKKIV